MEIDPLETMDKLREDAAADQARHRLNTLVAITVALLATFTGICKVKDDNIVQAMQQAQANKIDDWSFYQVRNIREDLAKDALIQLELTQANDAAAKRAQLAEYQKRISDEGSKKIELKAQAEQDQKDYDALNFRDDQFDLSDAAVAIAISLLAVTALTQLWWLYLLALLPTGAGILMGLAGLLEWPIHPDTLIKLLS